MILEKFVCGPFETNAYLLVCDETHAACVIDPALGSLEKVKKALSKLPHKVEKILLTHTHWDHIADVFAMKEAFGCSVWTHPLDVPNLEKPGTDGLPSIVEIKPVKNDGLLEENQIYKVGNLEIKVIHTPGHSPGSVCLYLENYDVLFSGDTLFYGAIGNLSFPTSDPEKMWESLKKLEKLPPKTRVLPGHGPDTILENEKWLSRAEELYGFH